MLGARVTLLGRLPVPLERLPFVLFHSEATLEAYAEVELCERKALFRGFAIPGCREPVVRRDAAAVFILRPRLP